ncbi:universal stress protein [Actinophytocola sp.]|uniref:universal stress protein n=1 Tax=Actinophytocola sp. TaxID=1872138 RepID=UPI003899C492
MRYPVVVGVDGSATALHAVAWAARRASRDRLPLRIVHAYHLPLGSPSGVTEEEPVLDVLRRDGRRCLDEARDLATMAVPGLDVATELTAMPTTTGLLRESEHASVLVLGNRGRSAVTGVLLSSTSLMLATHAHCAVVLVGEGSDNTSHGSPRTGPVVVGVDGTEASEAAVAFAFAEADAADATLLALTAYTESVFETALAGNNVPMDWTLQRELADRTLAERLAGWQEKYPQVHVQRAVIHGRPTMALRRCAQTARLVVVGRRGRGGFRDLISGSTSMRLMHHAVCPIVVVRTETTDQ